MYSQNDEEKWILEIVGDIPSGRFLDLGAFDGKTISNTLALVERGWSGVCFEPSPPIFVRLLDLHGKNDQVDLVNAAVTVDGGFVEFWDGDALSTVSFKQVEHWTGGGPGTFRPFYIQTMKLADVFEKFDNGYHFINIDVEGISFDLLRNLPFELLMNLKLLCVEHENRPEEMTKFMQEAGFKMIHRTGENLMFGRA